MSVFLWCFGQEIYGAGKTKEDAEQDGMEIIGTQLIRPLQKAAELVGPAFAEGLVPSMESIRLRGVTIEFGMVGNLSVDAGRVDFEKLLIEQIRGRTTTAPVVAIPFEIAPPVSDAPIVDVKGPAPQPVTAIVTAATVPVGPINGTAGGMVEGGSV